MRILQVRFKNLNSLVGAWEIDLTHPAYDSDGIFAISGPTGAGKSTILDAICLALYGRTPRLHKVNKSANEIMSRQTGDCFAEVTFATQKGRFRCYWGQHRAKKRSNGELQKPKHEIVDADTGKIIESNVRGVAEQIEAATGMDFDRFTRSMLLAQGGFAVFLQAAPDERAPILEQITGTEIYSTISIRVHERRADERKKLEALQAELAGMALLSPEDEHALRGELEKQIRSDEAFAERIVEYNRALVWLEGMARLELDLAQLSRQKDDISNSIAAFAEDRERLAAANRALELAGDHGVLTAVRNEQDKDLRALAEYRSLLPEQEQKAKLAETEAKTAAEHFDLQKKQRDEAMPAIRKVRELDLKIAEKNAPIQAGKENAEELSKALESLGQQQSSDCLALEQKRHALQELLVRLEGAKADEALVEQFTGIRGRCEALQRLHVQYQEKLNDVADADKRLQDAVRYWRESETAFDDSKQQLQERQASYERKQDELRTLLNDRELSDWRKEQVRLNECKELFGKAADTAESWSQAKQTVSAHEQRKTVCLAEQARLTGELSKLSEQQSALEKEAELLETQCALLQRIEELEQMRHRLQDGEPCPLCGAIEHPYAEGNVPKPDASRERLKQAGNDLKVLRDTVTEQKVKLGATDKELEQLDSAIKEQHGKIEQSVSSLVQLCSELAFDFDPADADAEWLRQLIVQQDRNTQDAAKTAEILMAADAAEQALKALRDSLETIKDAVAKADTETRSAMDKKDFAGLQLEQSKKDAENLHQQIETLLSQIRELFRPFGFEQCSIDTLDVLLEQLRQRQERWLGGQQQKIEHERTIHALETETRHRAERIQVSEQSLTKQRESIDGLVRERDAYALERQAIFGDKHPDKEEACLTEAVDNAERQLEQARRHAAAALQESDRLKANVAGLEQAVDTRAGQIDELNRGFIARLEAAGFADEANYLTACLPENERTRLAEQAKQLLDRQTEILAKEQEKTVQLKQERQKQLTAQTPDELKTVLAVLTNEQKALQQAIGAIQQKLSDNERIKQLQQSRAEAIDRQKRECSKWDRLHELIGSSDGKKYRNFAQGLTFEMMIGHANRQLQRMTERYLLIRDEREPLELNVIDNYQAGEVRSTKNLSGGESFIVSLSLALGLSHMSSKNVRVDSLFLDEGFGTLDEDALDTALETLAGLQQDGKLIGVISHVPALKERIGTQISVAPLSGGRSALAGPGCRRLNEE